MRAAHPGAIVQTRARNTYPRPPRSDRKERRQRRVQPTPHCLRSRYILSRLGPARRPMITGPRRARRQTISRFLLRNTSRSPPLTRRLWRRSMPCPGNWATTRRQVPALPASTRCSRSQAFPSRRSLMCLQKQHNGRGRTARRLPSGARLGQAATPCPISSLCCGAYLP